MHFLSGHYARSIDKPYAAVRVELKKNQLVVIPGSFMIANADVQYMDLPAGYHVVSQDGDIIPASGRFMISSETFDPVHLLIDYSRSNES